MQKVLSSLLMVVVLTDVLGVLRPAQAQVSIQIGPRPSPYHVWVPERRVWNGRRYVHRPGHWERRQLRREQRREQWRAQRRARWREQRWREQRWQEQRWREQRRWDRR